MPNQFFSVSTCSSKDPFVSQMIGSMTQLEFVIPAFRILGAKISYTSVDFSTSIQWMDHTLREPDPIRITMISIELVVEAMTT
jgi:hypothetical protein